VVIRNLDTVQSGTANYILPRPVCRIENKVTEQKC